MLTPDDMAARYAAAARRCADPVPCGWCLWRAGYRKGRKPRVSHRRPSPGGDLDLFNTGPADPGSNDERTRPMTDWKIKIGDADTITIRAATRTEAISIATARGGVVRVTSAAVVDGFDRSVQVATYEITTRAKRMRAAAGEAVDGDTPDGSTGDDE